MTDAVLARRADIDAKQAILTRLFTELECEAVILFMPAHVAWFTGGMATRGLIADGERPGVYTNGRQRWLLCSNIDTQRLSARQIRPRLLRAPCGSSMRSRKAGTRFMRLTRMRTP